MVLISISSNHNATESGPSVIRAQSMHRSIYNDRRTGLSSSVKSVS